MTKVWDKALLVVSISDRKSQKVGFCDERSTHYDGREERGHSSLYDSPRDHFQTASIGSFVAVIDAEIKVVRSIDLDIYESWAEDVTTQIDDSCRSQASEKESTLSIEDDTSLRVDPEVSFDETPVFKS